MDLRMELAVRESTSSFRQSWDSLEGSPQDGHWSAIEVKSRIKGATQHTMWFCTAARSKLEITL